MERLTERDEFGNADIIGVGSADLQLNLDFDAFNRVTEALNRLASYEDLEEQGRLVVLPCKIGDEVWCIKRFNRARKVVSAHVSEMYFSSEMRLVIVCYHAVRGELGKTVFLTREEAEKALEGVSEDA